MAFQDSVLLATMVIEQEIKSYSWISLVPDILGSLGLFLGFSFFMNVSYTHFVIQAQKGLNLSLTLSTLIILANLNVLPTSL